MAKLVKVTAANLKVVSRSLITAHAAIAEGIATHAEKHEATLAARRKKAEQDKAIQEGISRNAGQV